MFSKKSMRTRYNKPNSGEQIQLNKSRAQSIQSDRQKQNRMNMQLAMRNNPFLEAIEAKKRFAAEQRSAEIDLLPISVDDAINLEQQLQNDPEIDIEFEESENSLLNDLETFAVCPCCFKPTLSLMEFSFSAFYCSFCFLKVASKGASLKEFADYLVNHISRHEMLGCSGTVMFTFQNDLGLFSNCSRCDEIAFIA